MTSRMEVWSVSIITKRSTPHRRCKSSCRTANPSAAEIQEQVEAQLKRNGLHNTCYAGAWLYNGLHEGAIQSALAVKAHFEV